jgi:hypothetical protein
MQVPKGIDLPRGMLPGTFERSMVLNNTLESGTRRSRSPWKAGVGGYPHMIQHRAHFSTARRRYDHLWQRSTGYPLA